MKRLVLAILGGAALYSAFWVWSARDLAADVDQSIADMRAAGIVLDYDRRALKGFPSRLDLTIEGLSVTTPEGLQIDTALVQGLQTVWQRDRWILVFPSDITIGKAGAAVTLRPEAMRASLGQELVLEAETLSATIGTATLTAGPVLLAARPRGAGAYQVFLRATSLSPGASGPEPAPELVFDGTLRFAEAFALTRILPPLMGADIASLSYPRLPDLAEALRPAFPDLAAMLDQRQ